jgi:phosphohistidine phosphatase
MKTLILMRHAKSGIPEKGQHDWDRTLTKRGRKNTESLAKWLKEKNIVPQVILASAALRSRQTADLLTEELGFRGDLHFLSNLYLGEVDAYLDALHSMPDSTDCLLVIGHNPMLESLLQMLTGKVESLPTASVVFVQAPVDKWRELSFEITAKLETFWKPKE